MWSRLEYALVYKFHNIKLVLGNKCVRVCGGGVSVSFCVCACVCMCVHACVCVLAYNLCILCTGLRCVHMIHQVFKPNSCILIRLRESPKGKARLGHTLFPLHPTRHAIHPQFWTPGRWNIVPFHKPNNGLPQCPLCTRTKLQTLSHLNLMRTRLRSIDVRYPVTGLLLTNPSRGTFLPFLPGMTGSSDRTHQPVHAPLKLYALTPFNHQPPSPFTCYLHLKVKVTEEQQHCSYELSITKSKSVCVCMRKPRMRSSLTGRICGKPVPTYK